MCGLAGFVDPMGRIDRPQEVLRSMGARLVHRGPDDNGIWWDEIAGIGLSHRRLSIQDLSKLGAQPMHSPSGRYVIAYNGEVYNFRDLAAELAKFGCSFNGHSDTEVILAAVEMWGVSGAIERFIGMFAIVLWDRDERCLWLVRDRLGIKPLYFGTLNSLFFFASEIGCFDALPGSNSFSVNRNALGLFMRHNYIPSPYSIYENIEKVRPGEIIRVNLISSGAVAKERFAYWSLETHPGDQPLFDGGDEEAKDKLEELLRDSVELRMIADRPLGAFLSGGIDSSCIVALMMQQSDTPIRTFSIGFEESEFNEAHWAARVAKHLGTNHTELIVTAQDALSVVYDLPSIYDEPFSDSSQIPTILVSRLARRDVTVVLSGDGGDELFYGYNHYAVTSALWRRMSRVPLGLRHFLASLLKALPDELYDSAEKFSQPIFRKYGTGGLPSQKFRRLAQLMVSPSFRDLFCQLISHWKDPEQVVIGCNEPMTLANSPPSWMQSLDIDQYMMILDLQQYLPDDILTKVDRASMSVGLEARVPLLDHRVVQFARSLPPEYRVRSGERKWLLREVLRRHLSNELIDRPKMGFGVPIKHWLRGALREWAEELLDERRLRDEGFFNVEVVRSRWEEHMRGDRDWQAQIWDVLMFQSWLEARKAVGTANE